MPSEVFPPAPFYPEVLCAMGLVLTNGVWESSLLSEGVSKGGVPSPHTAH